METNIKKAIEELANVAFYFEENIDGKMRVDDIPYFSKKLTKTLHYLNTRSKKDQ